MRRTGMMITVGTVLAVIVAGAVTMNITTVRDQPGVPQPVEPIVATLDPTLPASTSPPSPAPIVEPKPVPPAPPQDVDDDDDTDTDTDTDTDDGPDDG